MANPTPKAIQREVMLNVQASRGYDLNRVREQCAGDGVALTGMRKSFEGQYGRGSFPTNEDYCRAGVERAVQIDDPLGLYLNLTVQQLGRDTEYDDKLDRALVGTKPVELVRDVRKAAEAGERSYTGAGGQTLPLACGLALDAGAQWAAANIKRVNRPALSPKEIKDATRACYTPGTETITLRGESMPAARAGLILGEIIGRDEKLKDRPPETGSVAPTPATPTRKRTSDAREGR